MHRLSFRRTLVVLAMFACSDSTAPDAGCEVETNPPSAPGIALSISPTCASVTRGAETKFIATVSRVGGFMGAISAPVELEGLPPGITHEGLDVTIAPPPGGFSATISIHVSATAPVGTHTITVRARAIDAQDATTRFELTIR